MGTVSISELVKLETSYTLAMFLLIMVGQA